MVEQTINELMAGLFKNSQAGSSQASQELIRTAAAYRATVLKLTRRMIDGQRSADTVHAIRTHCRRLQALLELCGHEAHAVVMAESVGRLSKLRALQVFQQYLAKIEASQANVDTVEGWIVTRDEKLRNMQVYHKIEGAVCKHAIPTHMRLKHLSSKRLEVLRHMHEKNLAGLISAASDKPRRKRLHALRLALKTLRYQTEWLPGRHGSKKALAERLKKVQTVLGRYEEMADFRRWGKALDLKVQSRIQRDWKRSRTRARAVPMELTWVVDALASGDFWIGMDLR